MALLCCQCQVPLNCKGDAFDACLEVHGSLIYQYCCNCFLTDGRQCDKCKARAATFWKEHSFSSKSEGRPRAGVRDAVDLDGEEELMRINSADISAMLEAAEHLSPTKLNACQRDTGGQSTPREDNSLLVMMESPSDLFNPTEKLDTVLSPEQASTPTPVEMSGVAPAVQVTRIASTAPSEAATNMARAASDFDVHPAFLSGGVVVQALPQPDSTGSSNSPSFIASMPSLPDSDFSAGALLTVTSAPTKFSQPPQDGDTSGAELVHAGVSARLSALPDCDQFNVPPGGMATELGRALSPIVSEPSLRSPVSPASRSPPLSRQQPSKHLQSSFEVSPSPNVAARPLSAEEETVLVKHAPDTPPKPQPEDSNQMLNALGLNAPPDNGAALSAAPEDPAASETATRAAAGPVAPAAKLSAVPAAAPVVDLQGTASSRKILSPPASDAGSQRLFSPPISVRGGVGDEASAAHVRATAGPVEYSQRGRGGQQDGVAPFERVRRWARVTGLQAVEGARQQLKRSVQTAAGEASASGLERCQHACLVCTAVVLALGLAAAWLAMVVVAGRHLDVGRHEIARSWLAFNCSVVPRGCRQACRDPSEAEQNACADGDGGGRRGQGGVYLSENCVFISRDVTSASTARGSGSARLLKGTGAGGWRRGAGDCVCKEESFFVDVSVRYGSSQTALSAQCSGGSSDDVCGLAALKHRGRTCDAAQRAAAADFCAVAQRPKRVGGHPVCSEVRGRQGSGGLLSFCAR